MSVRLLLTVGLMIAAAGSAAAAENRCGWLENPTPGNWWLTDKDGSWTLMAQGEEYRESVMDQVPPFDEKQYVATNGNYGYGCACLSVDVDKAEGRIARVYSGKIIPLSRCEKDRSLKRTD